jgi:hypothetical protein
MSIGDFDHFGYSLVHVLSFATISKFKDERMFQSSWSPEDQQAVERIAKKLDIDLEANDLAGSDATFTSIEGAASKIGRAVTRQVIEDLAIKQTRLLTQPQPCPSCDKLCEVQGHTRSLTTGDGTAEIQETVCHCSACRRDFFPSTRAVETSPTWL